MNPMGFLRRRSPTDDYDVRSATLVIHSVSVVSTVSGTAVVSRCEYSENEPVFDGRKRWLSVGNTFTVTLLLPAARAASASIAACAAYT